MSKRFKSNFIQKLKDKMSSSKKEGGDFSWDDTVSKIFSPEARGAIHKAFIVSLVSTGSYFGGKTTSSVVQSKIKVKKVKKAPATQNLKSPNYRNDINKIVRTNLFNAKKSDAVKPIKPVEEPKKIDISEIICNRAEKKSALPIKLKNTIVLQDQVKSIASVEVRGKKKLLDLRQGEKVDALAEISYIDRLEIIVKNLKTGECEFITNRKKQKKDKYKILSPKKGKKLLGQFKSNEIQNIGNKFKIKKDLRDRLLGNISEILTQARAIQIKNPNGTYSFKMTEITPGSIYSKLNIQDNDTIHAINGKEFRNINEIMNELGRLKSTSKYEITLSRDGEKKVLEYEFY